MKNSKEMADAVFRIRDACLEQKRRRIRIVRRISAVGGAACLCGLLITAGIHFAPVREPLPGIPPETAATGTQTTAPTTIVTETTAQTAASVKTQTSIPETTGAVTSSSKTESATLPETTQAPAIVTQLNTSSASVSSFSKTERSSETATPATYRTETVIRPPVTTSPPAEHDTPAETGTLYTTVKESASVTELETIPESPIQSYIPETEAPTEGFPKPIESGVPTNPGSLPGFRLETADANGREYVYNGVCSPSPEGWVPYILHSAEYSAKAMSILESDASEALGSYYCLKPADPDGMYFYISLKKREQFTFFCTADSVLSPADICGSPGVFIRDDSDFMLIWDDGRYTLTMTGTAEHRDTMLTLAQQFIMQT